MKREDDQELWDLLGRTPEIQLSPFFARNITRELREQKRTWRDRATAWLGLKRLLPATGVAVALLAAILLTHTPATSPKNWRSAVPSADAGEQDADLAADLDDLTRSDDNGALDDDSSL